VFDSADTAVWSAVYNTGDVGGREVLSLAGNGNRIGYAGYVHDSTVQTMTHTRHRVLLTDHGRWTRRDPLGFVDSMNLSSYSAGRAVLFTDPMGTLLCPQASPFTCNGSGGSVNNTVGPPDFCSLADDGSGPTTDSQGNQIIMGMSIGIPDFLVHGNHCGPGYGPDFPGEADPPDDGDQKCGANDNGHNQPGSCQGIDPYVLSPDCPFKTCSDYCCVMHDKHYYSQEPDVNYQDPCLGEKSCHQKWIDNFFCNCLRNAHISDAEELISNWLMRLVFCRGNDGAPGDLDDCNRKPGVLTPINPSLDPIIMNN